MDDRHFGYITKLTPKPWLVWPAIRRQPRLLQWRQLASSKPTGRWNVRLIRRLIKYTHPIRWMCDLMERSTVHGPGLWYSGVWLVDTRCRGMACPGVHAFSRRRTQRVAVRERERERGAAVFRYIQKSQNNGYQKGYEPHQILNHYCSTFVRFSILRGTFGLRF
jgi:hypothetical protein